MPRAPKTEADLRAWEAKKGFRGVIFGGQIFRKCVECDQPTLSLDETHCPKDGGKRQVRSECQVEGCTNRAKRAKGTLCQGCWVAEDPEARGCPACQKRPKCHSRADGLCSHCVKRAAFAAKLVERRAELAQLCDDEGIEEGPTDVKDAAFRTRYVVLNDKDDHKPYMRVRKGDEWKPRVRRARVRPRGGACPRHAQHALRRARRRQVRARAGLVQLHRVQPEHHEARQSLLAVRWRHDCFQQTDEARRARPLPDVRGGRRRRGGGRGGGQGGEAGAARGQEAEARQAPGAQDARAARACRLR